MTAGSVILEDDGSGGFTERHIPKTPTELNAGGGSASAAWPIGSIYIGTTATNPSVLFGFGTWQSIGAGRVLIGQDTGDTDFDTLGETGGSKAVQASAQSFAGNVLATHQHAAITAGTPAGTISAISATQTSAGKVGTSTANLATNVHTHPAPTFTGAALGTHQHAAVTAGTPSGTNTPGAATSVVQPYLVVRLWERVS